MNLCFLRFDLVLFIMIHTLIYRVFRVKRVFRLALLMVFVLATFNSFASVSSAPFTESAHQALSSLNAYFEVDTAYGCAHHTTNFPVEITDQSTGVIDQWQYLIYGEDPITPIFDQVYAAAPTFTYDFINNTDHPIEFTIRLFVENAGGDISEFERKITVYPSIRAQFTRAYIDGACANPRNVRFTNLSSNNTPDKYYWTLGDGTNRESTAHNEVFEHEYENLTTGGVDYDVQLVAQSDFGCRDTAVAQVYVTSNFIPEFEVSYSKGCAPLDIDVENNSYGDISTYSWSVTPDPGGLVFPVNGDDFSIQLPNTTASPIDYVLRLTLTNTDGCAKYSELTITVYPQVEVSFSPEDLDICDSSEVVFTSTLTNPAIPNISYDWDFDDDVSSDKQNPTHIFRNVGDAFIDRNVTLIATSGYECSDDFSTTVTVHPKIKANFSVSDIEICSGEEVTFNYERMPSISTYTFDFDGYIPNTWPGDALANGTFNKEFINQTGAPFTLDITLITNNTNPACHKDFTVPVTVNPEVTAGFTWTGDSPQGCNPFEVTFTNATEYTGGSVFSGTYYWDFGDGTTSTQANPVHVFYNDHESNTATYTVTLTATSVHGCEHIFQDDITIQPRLTAGFSMTQPDICVPEFVFTPSSPGATEYNWNFDGLIPPETILNGDPFTRTINPTHPDNLTTGVITLTVENAAGCTDVTAKDIEIQPHIVPNFSVDETVGCSDLEVLLTNNSTGGSLEYFWNFDDEQTFYTVSEDPFTHTFINRSATDRVFEVWLKAKNVNGCKDSTSVDVTVHPKVEADFSFSYDSLCTPFRVAFVNSSLNGSTFEWDFGQAGFWEDDTTTLKANPEFEFTLDNPTANDIGNYSISVHAYTFHATSGLTCEDTRIVPFGEVYPRVVANYNVDVSEGCNPLTVEFNNTSTGLGTYEWTFGDGGPTSNEESPTRILGHANTASSEVYNVRLTSTNVNGCKDVLEMPITVYPLVQSAFTIDEDDGCTPLPIQFTNSKVSPAYDYTWDFGDGQTSTDTQPGEITIENTLYPLALFEPTITLVTQLNSTYPQGCPETSDTTVTVYPRVIPNFDGNFDGCHPLTVNFENTTEAYDIGNATYKWTLGNGESTTIAEPTQAYFNNSSTKDTTYTVKLLATSVHGCKDSIDDVITVYPKPKSMMEILSGYYACSPYEVEIKNSSEGKGFGSTLEFTFDFGDGSPNVNTTDPSNLFHPYASNTSEDIVSYTIELDVVTEDGCTHESSQTVHIYPEVTADFEFDPGNADCNPFLVQMVNNSNENAHDFTWNFGDGTPESNLFEPINLFENTTTEDVVYEVTLTASSDYGCESTTSDFVTVYAAPVANFVIQPPLQIFPSATFAFQNLTNPAGDDWDYDWTFGDGYTDDVKDPDPHTYETWGPIEDDFRYLVTLKVANNNCSDSTSRYLTLKAPQPIADFDANQYEACSPLVVYFENNSEYGHTYLWDFGDGTFSDEFEPVHTYEESGYYNVSLKVTGDGGDRYYFAVFQVYENPIADFVVTPQEVILPDARVNIYNRSVGALNYIWDLGDGTIAYTEDVIHTYSEMGEYRIHLTAISEHGCVDTTFKFPAVWVKGSGLIRFPNAFVPSKLGSNGGYYDDVDFSNEVFHPITEAVGEYRLMIFNRWGEQIFESDDVKIGWDGYYKGKLSNQDVYVYRAVGKFTNGRTFDVRGNVTLLR